MVYTLHRHLVIFTKLNTVLNSGKGNQWYGYNITKVGPVNDPAMYERAKQFYQSLASK
jgi:hypothetical protein